MNRIESIIKELADAAAASKEELQVKTYHPEDAAAAAALQKYTDTLFKERVKLLRQPDGDHGEFPADCGYDVLTRRKTALVDLAYATGKRFRSKYPMLPIEEEYIRLNAPTAALTFDELNDIMHIELAAAIRILDYLSENDRMDEALEFLPSSRRELDSVMLPNISDSVHNDDMLKGVLYVIRNRNRSKAGFDGKKAFMDGADTRLNGNDGAAHSEDRKNYEAIIHLIDTQTICDLREMFLSAMVQVADKLLAVLWEYQTELRALTSEKLRIINAATEKVRSTETRRSSAAITVSGNTGEAEILPTLYSALEEIRSIDDRLNTIRDQKEAYCLNAPLFAIGRTDELQQILGEAALMKLPVVDAVDPYSFCFAFLNLLDTDSDHAWTYNIPLYVLASACGALPWAIVDTDNEEAEMNPSFLKAALNCGESYIVPPAQNLLNQRIIDPPFVGSGRKISFKQLVYMVAGLTPPRAPTGMSYIKALFADSGLSKGEIDILYEYLALAYSVSHRDTDYVFIDDEESEEADAQPEIAETAVDDKELKALKLETKKLKGIINRLEHKIKSDAEELQKTHNRLNSATKELSELRSMIRQAAPTDEAYTATVTFPYSSKKRAVVFGGHESWRKSLKPLLNNVRFVDNGVLPNTSLIMNAEVVWIQTNAMAHSNFYKIIDVIRKHNIELHYFKYSGAEKCAEQFALTDMGDSENEPKE